MDAVATLYGKAEFKKDVTIKTAVGSPGFLEIILPNIPAAAIATVILIKYSIGRVKTEDGSATGILALLSKINEFINDYHNRKKVDAEAELIRMQAEKTKAEAALIRAQTKEINIRTENMEQELSEKTAIEIEQEDEKLVLISENDAITEATKISDSSKKIINAASQSGITFDGKRVC